MIQQGMCMFRVSQRDVYALVRKSLLRTLQRGIVIGPAVLLSARSAFACGIFKAKEYRRGYI